MEYGRGPDRPRCCAGLAPPCHPARYRRELVFFEADDYRLYRRLIATEARRARTAVWAYCLMPNHVHLIVTPADEDGLRATFCRSAPAPHRGHQRSVPMDGPSAPRVRFGAVMMGEPHLLAAARYIALNLIDGRRDCVGVIGRKKAAVRTGQSL